MMIFSKKTAVLACLAMLIASNLQAAFDPSRLAVVDVDVTTGNILIRGNELTNIMPSALADQIKVAYGYFENSRHAGVDHIPAFPTNILGGHDIIDISLLSSDAKEAQAYGGTDGSAKPALQQFYWDNANNNAYINWYYQLSNDGNWGANSWSSANGPVYAEAFAVNYTNGGKNVANRLVSPNQNDIPLGFFDGANTTGIGLASELHELLTHRFSDGFPHVIYFHCSAGRDRTGALTMAYRLLYGGYSNTGGEKAQGSKTYNNPNYPTDSQVSTRIDANTYIDNLELIINPKQASELKNDTQYPNTCVNAGDDAECITAGSAGDGQLTSQNYDNSTNYICNAVSLYIGKHPELNLHALANCRLLGEKA